MRSARTIAGAVASALWLGVVAYLLLRDTSALAKMTPNEWGDFLAGCFAPLAFLWLVLGYLQQGEELRLSTETLRLQAEELKNSVQQQRELVEVSRLQVESERETLAFERKLREDLSLPKFLVHSSGGSFSSDGASTYSVTISNTGHDATAFSAKLQFRRGPWRDLMYHALFGKGASYSTIITYPLTLLEATLALRYTDGLGRTVETLYKVNGDNENTRAGLTFRQVEA